MQIDRLGRITAIDMRLEDMQKTYCLEILEDKGVGLRITSGSISEIWLPDEHTEKRLRLKSNRNGLFLLFGAFLKNMKYGQVRAKGIRLGLDDKEVQARLKNYLEKFGS